MSQTIDGLVETSSSLARVILKDGLFITQSLQKVLLRVQKDVAQSVGATFHNIGANVEHSGSYPGWAPDANSEILNIMVLFMKTCLMKSLRCKLVMLD